jgi:hypothetical protein
MAMPRGLSEEGTASRKAVTDLVKSLDAHAAREASGTQEVGANCDVRNRSEVEFPNPIAWL